MTYSGQPVATPGAALEHFGVKGMRWGVRKSDKPTQRPIQPDPVGYTKRMQKNDSRSFILSKNKGVENIKKSMNEQGLTRKEAYEKEVARRNKRNGVIASVAYVGLIYAANVPPGTLASSVSQRAETKRGERRAKEYVKTRGLPQQTSKPREASARRSRRTGAYNITSL